MTVNRPELNPLARAAIREIEATDAKLQPDDVVWLNSAAENVRRRSRRHVESLVDWPVSVGGVLLWPLTFAALEWFRFVPEDLQDDVAALAFALCHGRDPERLQALTDATAIRAAVRDWCRGVRCSPAAMRAAIGEILNRNGQAVDVPDAVPRKTNRIKADEAVSYGGVLGSLMRRYPGAAPRWWFWEASIDTVTEMLLEGAKDDAARAGGHVPDAREFEAFAEFRSVVKYLVETRKPGVVVAGIDHG